MLTLLGEKSHPIIYLIVYVSVIYLYVCPCLKVYEAVRRNTHRLRVKETYVTDWLMFPIIKVNGDIHPSQEEKTLFIHSPWQHVAMLLPCPFMAIYDKMCDYCLKILIITSRITTFSSDHCHCLCVCGWLPQKLYSAWWFFDYFNKLRTPDGQLKPIPRLKSTEM